MSRVIWKAVGYRVFPRVWSTHRNFADASCRALINRNLSPNFRTMNHLPLNSVSVEAELRKNPTLKKSDIGALKKWCDEQHYPLNEADSALFLHSSYYYPETAKSLIERYHATRHSMPQFFSNRSVDSEESKRIFDTVAIIPLTKLTREKYRVILIRPLSVEQRDIRCDDLIRVLNMVLDVDVHESGTQAGYVFVADVHGSNIFERSSFDATAVKAYFEYLQRSVPIRWFGLHLVNTLLPFEQKEPFTRLSIVQNDFVDAIYFHSDLDSLNEVVPTDALPSEMGGRAGPLRDLQAAEVAKLWRYSVWFTMMEEKDASSRCFREIFATLSNFVTDLRESKSGGMQRGMQLAV